VKKAKRPPGWRRREPKAARSSLGARLRLGGVCWGKDNEQSRSYLGLDGKNLNSSKRVKIGGGLGG
jgi:hypothetical protein